MTQSDPIGGVQLPHFPGSIPSASDTLYQITTQAIEHFPDVFRGIRVPINSPFLRKLRFTEFAMNFEFLRATSGERLEIAAFITDLVQRSFVFESNQGTTTLEQAFSHAVPPLPVLIEDPRGKNKAQLHIAHRGRLYNSREDFLAMLAGFLEHGLITTEAGEALEWAFDHVSDVDWTSAHIAGKKFALLGGTAELSPISHLLAAGADVLTTHSSMKTLDQKLAAELGSRVYPGRLFYFRDGVDLLLSPVAIAGTIITFGEGQRVNVGAFAYRGGEGREWRLGAAMDGIIRSVASAKVLDSVTFYLSPSITTEISEETARLSEERFEREYSSSGRLLNWLTFGSFLQPNVMKGENTFFSRSIVSYQGASYVAANLFGKIYPAEIYCTTSTPGSPSALRVSANVAPITETASTITPKTRPMFAQARHMGIEVFDPATTRTLMYLLMINDLFNSCDPCRNVFARQIHGGVFTNRWALESAMRLAYFKGLVAKKEEVEYV